MVNRMGSAFRESDPDLWWKIPLVLALLAVALALVWLLACLEKRKAQHHHHPQPMRLYLDAMSAIRVGWIHRWHMWRLARALKLPHPLALLISPACFDEAVARYSRTESLNARTVQCRFGTIRKQLFG